jgi:hypothetical protein
MNLETKDWIYLAGLIITFGTFWLKLANDIKFARYRETINYIERREEKKREQWVRIQNLLTSDNPFDNDAYIFLGQLELVAVLIKKNAFDAEIVYTFWWKYLFAPMQDTKIKAWIDARRSSDKAVLEHYLWLCKKWEVRIRSEQT